VDYDAFMRTTVDLPPALHLRARELAASSRQSLSAVLADLVARGLRTIDQPTRVTTDPNTGFPKIDIGATVTVSDVNSWLDED
jgi:predicted transcriptional regulator